MSQFPDERGAELKQLFFETAMELLQSLNDETLKLEKQPGDLETVRSIRRIVHTLKGDSAAVGYHELSELAHEFEDALALETSGAPTALAEVAFAAADTFSAMLTCYRNETKLPSPEPVRKMIRKMARDPKTRKPRASKAQAASAPQVEWTEYEKLATQAALKQGKQVYHVTAQVDPNCAMPIAAQQLILKALAEMWRSAGNAAGNRVRQERHAVPVAGGERQDRRGSDRKVPHPHHHFAGKDREHRNSGAEVVQKAKAGEAAPKPAATPTAPTLAPATQPKETVEVGTSAEPQQEIETILPPSSEREITARTSPATPGECLARGCRAHRHRAQSRRRTDHRQIDAAAGAQ